MSITLVSGGIWAYIDGFSFNDSNLFIEEREAYHAHWDNGLCYAEIKSISDINIKFTGEEAFFNTFPDCGYRVAYDSGHGSNQNPTPLSTYAKYKASVQVSLYGNFFYYDLGDEYTGHLIVRLYMYYVSGSSIVTVGSYTATYTSERTFSSTYTYTVYSTGYVPSGKHLYVNAEVHIYADNFWIDADDTLDFSTGANHIGFGSVHWYKYYATGGGGWDYQ